MSSCAATRRGAVPAWMWSFARRTVWRLRKTARGELLLNTSIVDLTLLSGVSWVCSTCTGGTMPWVHTSCMGDSKLLPNTPQTLQGLVQAASGCLGGRPLQPSRRGGGGRHPQGGGHPAGVWCAAGGRRQARCHHAAATRDTTNLTWRHPHLVPVQWYLPQSRISQVQVSWGLYLCCEYSFRFSARRPDAAVSRRCGWHLSPCSTTSWQGGLTIWARWRLQCGCQSGETMEPPGVQEALHTVPRLRREADQLPLCNYGSHAVNQLIMWRSRSAL
jgi:hypothetical protein